MWNVYVDKVNNLFPGKTSLNVSMGQSWQLDISTRVK